VKTSELGDNSLKIKIDSHVYCISWLVTGYKPLWPLGQNH